MVNVARNQLTTADILQVFKWFHGRFNYEKENNTETERWRETLGTLTTNDLKRAMKKVSKMQSDAAITRRRMTRPPPLEIFYGLAVYVGRTPPKGND